MDVCTNVRPRDAVRSTIQGESDLKSIKQHNTSNELFISLVGNKVDRVDDRMISAEQGKALADSFGIEYFEVSAKSGEGVEQAFLSLAKAQLERKAQKTQQR